MNDNSTLHNRPMIQARVMGNLQLTSNTVRLGARDLGGPKPRQLLEVLLLNLGHPVSKDRLIDMLWAGRPPAGVRITLDSYASVLRRRLGPLPGGGRLLRTVNGGYVIDPAAVAVDDGVGFDAQAKAPSGHNGLALLSDALADTGGGLEIRSAPGAGTTVIGRIGRPVR